MNDTRRNLFCVVSFYLGLAALPLSAASPSGTEGGMILSLDDAVLRALENNLTLKKDLIDLSSAEYAADRLWSEIFPAISASAGASFSSPLFTGDGFDPDGAGQFSLGLGISLGFNAGIPYAMKNIRLAYQTKMLNYEDARNQLEIQTTKDFYSLLAERDNLVYLTDIYNLAERQLARNQTAFNNGIVGELTVMQSRLSLENARYNLSAANLAYTSRVGELLAALGIDQDTQAVLEGKIEITRIDADAEELIRNYLPQRPDIVSRRQEIERLETEEKQITLSARGPSLNLSTQWTGRNGGQSADTFTDSLSGTATVSIPIDPWIPGTSKSQSVQNAKLAVDKAKLDLKIAEDSAKTQIRSLVSNLRNSWDSIEIARFSQRVAERSYELTEQGFRNGTVESLTLEDARNNLANARQRLLQSELAYQTMILDLSAALNINWKDLNKMIPGESRESR
ncbi:MAG: TolC family protein [Treponema sp.]|nr:TolC family protein [Treponema sp.]